MRKSSPRKSHPTCSSPFATPSSTPIKKASSIATSTRATVLVEFVDGKPIPKVIDFGLARALGQKLTDKTLYTALDVRVGALE
jgi:hypothetical protein